MWLIIVLLCINEDIRGCLAMIGLGIVALWILKWLAIIVIGGFYLLLH